MSGKGRLRRRLVAALLGLACASCRSETPAAPSPSPEVDVTNLDPPLRLSEERYFLQLSAMDLTEDFRVWCQPIGVPRAGKFLTTFVWFEPSGDEYIGRARAPYRSTLEIRLRRTGWSLGIASLQGTVAGTVHDEYDRALGLRDLVFEVAPGTSATFSGIATQQGPASSAPPPVIAGTAEGTLTFRDSTGGLSRCPSASLFLQVVPAGSPHDDPTVPPLTPGLR
jgi:hypothetical protein